MGVLGGKQATGSDRHKRIERDGMLLRAPVGDVLVAVFGMLATNREQGISGEALAGVKGNAGVTSRAHLSEMYWWAYLEAASSASSV